MNRPSTTTTVVLVLLANTAWSQEKSSSPVPTSGVIRHVTLYREKGLITRELLVPAGERVREIEVLDLPERTVAESVSASGEGRTTVRSVRVALRAAGASQRDGVRELDRRLEELNQQQAAAQHTLDVVTRNLETLSQLITFTAAAGQADLTRGALNADTVTRLATFAMAQRRELSSEQFALQHQRDELAQQVKKLAAQRSELTSVRQPRAFEARILVETADGEAGTVRLSYLVSGCGWSPQYTVRGRTGDARFDLHYGAMIHQMSGERWRDVELELSTASPAVDAAGPVLAPLRVTVALPPGAGSAPADGTADPFGAPAADARSSPFSSPSANALAEALPALREQQRAAEAAWEAEPDDSVHQRDDELNSLAEEVQQLELQIEPGTWRALAPDAGEEVASQVYTLTQPVSLDSRREQQLVQVLEAQLEGEMYYVATPLLSTYAYREARLTNNQPHGLLGGPATVYLDNRFVGRMQLPSVASGQTMTIGLGADQQVRTRRELMSKQDEVKGGNRQLAFSYRLVLNNFKSQPIAVRLLDRMPIAVAPGQLTVQLDTPQVPLSADGLYQRMQRPTGVLRWDLDVPPHRHGSEAYDLHYRYTLEFDRNGVPTTKHLLAAILRDFEGEAIPGMGGMGGMGGYPAGGLSPMPGTGK